MLKRIFWLLVVIAVVLLAVLLVVNRVNSQAGASEWRRWTAPSDRRFVGDTLKVKVAEYDLRFSTSPLSENNSLSAERFSGVPVPGDPGTPESCLVTGLEFSTVYWFALRSRDVAGNWSGWSNIVQDTTADRTGPWSIVDFR